MLRTRERPSAGKMLGSQKENCAVSRAATTARASSAHPTAVLQQSDPNFKTNAGGGKIASKQLCKEILEFPPPKPNSGPGLTPMMLPPKTVPGVDRAHFHRQTPKELELADTLPPAAPSSTCPFDDPEGLGYQLQRQRWQQQRSLVLRCKKEYPNSQVLVQVFRLQNGRPVLSDIAKTIAPSKCLEMDVFTEEDFNRCRRGDGEDTIASPRAAIPQHPEASLEPKKQQMDPTESEDQVHQVTPSPIRQKATNISSDRDALVAGRRHSVPTPPLATPKTPSVFADPLSNLELHISSSAASQHPLDEEGTPVPDHNQSTQQPSSCIVAPKELSLSSLASPVPGNAQSDGVHTNVAPPCGIRFGSASQSTTRSATSSGDRPSTAGTPSAPPLIIEDGDMDLSAHFKVIPLDFNPKQPLKSVLKSAGVKRSSVEMEKSATKSITSSLESGFTSFSPSVKRRLWPSTTCESSSPVPRRLWSSAPTELAMTSELLMNSSLVEEAIQDDEPPKAPLEVVRDGTARTINDIPIGPHHLLRLGPSPTDTTSPDWALLNAPTEPPLTFNDSGTTVPPSSRRFPAAIPAVEWTLNDTVQSPVQAPYEPQEPEEQRHGSRVRQDQQQQQHQQQRIGPLTRAHVFSIDAAHYPSRFAASWNHQEAPAVKGGSAPLGWFSLPIPTVGVTIPLKIEKVLDPFLPGFAAFVAELGEIEFDVSTCKSNSVPASQRPSRAKEQDQAWLLEALLAPVQQRYLCYETPVPPPHRVSTDSEARCAYIANEWIRSFGPCDPFPPFYVLEGQCPELQRSLTLILLPPPPARKSVPASSGSFLQPLMDRALSNRSCNGVRYCLGVYLSTIHQLLLRGLIHSQLSLQTIFLAQTESIQEIFQEDLAPQSKKLPVPSNHNETILLDSIALGSGSVALDSRTSAFTDNRTSATVHRIKLSPPLERPNRALGELDLHPSTAQVVLCWCSQLQIFQDHELQQLSQDEEVSNSKGGKRPRLEHVEELSGPESTQIMTDEAVHLDSTWIGEESTVGQDADARVTYFDLAGLVQFITNEVSRRLPTTLSSSEWKWVRMLSHAIHPEEDSPYTHTIPVETILQPLLTSLQAHHLSEER